MQGKHNLIVVIYIYLFLNEDAETVYFMADYMRDGYRQRCRLSMGTLPAFTQRYAGSRKTSENSERSGR